MIEVPLLMFALLTLMAWPDRRSRHLTSAFDSEVIVRDD